MRLPHWMRYRNTDEDADKKNANTLDHNAYKLNKILYTFIYIFHSSKNKYLKKQRKLTLRYKLHLIWKKWKEVWQ